MEMYVLVVIYQDIKEHDLKHRDNNHVTMSIYS